MKTKTILVITIFPCFTAFGSVCGHCGGILLSGDRYCHVCGMERYESVVSNEPEYNYSANSSSGAADRLAGMGRGFVTTVFSPLNVVRGTATGWKWLVSGAESQTAANTGGITIGDLGPIGAAIAGGAISVCVGTGMTFGAFTTCVDAINGTLDMITAGYYGDWLYDSKESGQPTPWIWERKWYSSRFPWIGRE